MMISMNSLKTDFFLFVCFQSKIPVGIKAGSSNKVSNHLFAKFLLIFFFFLNVTLQ